MSARGWLVVGVDGSPGADTALAWAADEAYRRRTGLLIAHVDRLSDGLDRFAPIAGAAGQGLLAAAMALVAGRRPDVDVATVNPRGRPVERLVELSDGADLLVVGRHGRHARLDALLGGVAPRVAAYARCPVTVVPHPAKPASSRLRPVVAVGVGRSAGAMGALDAAFQHARRVQGSVLAIRAWGEMDRFASMRIYSPQSVDRWRLASEHLLNHCARVVASRYPGVPVDARLVRGSVAAALLDAAREADLVLIGGRRANDRRVSRLGWATGVLLAKSPVPVEVVIWPIAGSRSSTGHGRPVAGHAAAE